MNLEFLGYNKELERYRADHNLMHLSIGRVISEHKERYIVKTQGGKEYDAEIIGNLRYSAQKRTDFPAVGDWVSIAEYDDNKALIHAVLPRKTIIERQAIGKHGEKQIIATNIDFAFIVQAVDRDFNINRIERYLTICNTANVTPIIVLNKTDLTHDSELINLIEKVKTRIENVPILCTSNETQKGINQLKQHIQKGKTYCLLGSSGVGKSSLLNNLLGQILMKTDKISSSTNKGKHVTSHRELVILENGGIIIDNPGMREVGIANSTKGLDVTFEKITSLSKQCKFKDCTHTSEKGCAILKTVENGELDFESYENYIKMEKEKVHFEMTLAEKRRKDKSFGKLIKNYKKNKRLDEF